jgi:hypothetical protein
LDPTAEPRLFAELTRIAAATGQKLPESVYAVLDVNAAVWQHGGVLGAGEAGDGDRGAAARGGVGTAVPRGGGS